MSKKSNVALGTVLAAGIGYVAGVLTAPKSGAKTRKDLQKKALQAKAETEHKLKEIHSELAKILKDVNSKANVGKTKITSEYKALLDKAETSRQKVRELLSAIHEGEAEDKDLKKALNESSLALKHLKNYLGKKTSK